MRVRRTVGTGVLAALGVGLALAAAAPAAFGYGADLRRYPYLTDVVGTSATVNWGTNRTATAGAVKYGAVGTESCDAHTVTATKTAITVNSISPQYQWKARLSLAPDTEYCYRVYLGNASQIDLLDTDPSPHFKTQIASGASTPFSFAVFGDWGSVNSSGQNPYQANLMSQLAQSGARFAVTTGDNAYPSGSQTNYGDLVQTGQDTSAVFGPQFWKAPGASIPLFPAIGNHGFSGATSHLLNWPQDSAVADSSGRYVRETHCCLNGTNSAEYPSTWYAFDAGDARFYVLEAAWTSTNVGSSSEYGNDYDYHWAPTAAQYRWLQNDLATHPRALKFAFFHYPMYSDNSTEPADPFLRNGPNSLERLLGRYGVDVTFNGHAHTYQRNLPNGPDGIVSYVTGGGGAPLQPIGINGCSPTDAYGIGWSYSAGGGFGAGSACGAALPPTSVAQVFHFLKVTVGETGVTVTPTDSLGQPFDVTTYAKNATDADLSVNKTDSPDPVLVGQPLTYNLEVRNEGPSDAAGVVLTDQLPAGVTYGSATPSQGSCSEVAGTMTCSLGTLLNGGTATVQLEVTPQSDGTLTNTASVVGDDLVDTTTANNTQSQVTTVNPAADLSVATTDSPDPVFSGEPLTYTAAVSNSGPSPAGSVTLTDNLPPGVTYGSATPSQGTCQESTGIVSCDLGALASGASATVAIEVTPQSEGTLSNTMSVSGDIGDPNTANDSDSEETTVNLATADLSVSKSDSADPAFRGRSLTYTVSVQNHGPARATGVTLTDNLPSGVTYGSATPSQGNCGESGGTVTCDLGDLAVDGTATVTIDVTPESEGTLTNSVVVAGDRSDPESANDADSEQTTVNPAADLSVTKSDTADPVLVGQEISYTVAVDNHGPAGATGVTLTDNLPSGVTYGSATPSQGTCGESGGTVTCALGDLAVDGNATVTIVVTPQDDGPLTNNVSVSGDQGDPASANDTDGEQTTVAPLADLSVTKSDSPDPVAAGETITYTATVQNSGPSATDVTLTDQLPARVSYLSATPSQGSCNETGGTVSCALGSVSAGVGATVQIVVRPQARGTLTNNVSVEGDAADPAGANNSDSEDTTVASTFAHPASASPVSVSLVPVLRQCGTVANPADGQHAPPLSTPACSPPGTPAVAHVGAGSVGSAQIAAIPGDPLTPDDEADVSLDASVTDVREGDPAGVDYDPNSGGADLTLIAKLRITDYSSGASQTDAGTTTDLDYGVPVECTGTDGPEGATCAVATAADALMAGTILEGKGMIIQTFRLRLNDSGSNGVRGDGDDRLFEQQGYYVP